MRVIGIFFESYSFPLTWWVMAAMYLPASIIFTAAGAGPSGQFFAGLTILSVATAGILTAIRKGDQ